MVRPLHPFALHPSIDLEAARAAYARTGRIQIAPFIAEEGAELLRSHLGEREDWQLEVKAGDRYLRFDAAKTLGKFSAAFEKMAAPVEEEGFRYLFDTIKVVVDEKGPSETGTILADFALFLSSAPVLELLREISGEPDIDFADAQATRYRPGHFLTVHGDKKPGSRRLAAYVFGLTRAWRPEWGGLLLFHDDKGDVVQGFTPRMNALNLFAVPQDHSVSLVAPFAPPERYAVTGWLRPYPDRPSAGD